MNTLSKNLEALCLTIEGATKSNGTVNVSRAARELDIHQPTLLRMLKGESERARPENEEKICKRFGITTVQLYSDELADRIINGVPLSEIEKAREILKGLSKQERAQLFMDEAPELVDFFMKED